MLIRLKLEENKDEPGRGRGRGKMEGRDERQMERGDGWADGGEMEGCLLYTSDAADES